MQSKSESCSEFSVRTEVIALKTGLRLSDLPDFIGVSDSMFFAYRSGKQPISAKAWRKLAAAEVEAGLVEPAGSNALTTKGDSTLLAQGIAVGESSDQDISPKTPMLDIRIVMQRLAEISTELAAFQSQLAAYLRPYPETPLEDFIGAMKVAGAWPLSEEDGKLSFQQLLKKYRSSQAASLSSLGLDLDFVSDSNKFDWPTDTQISQ